jgi:hypothetical protein
MTRTEQDNENVHSTRNGDDGVIYQTDDDQTGAAKAKQPIPGSAQYQNGLNPSQHFRLGSGT